MKKPTVQAECFHADLNKETLKSSPKGEDFSVSLEGPVVRIARGSHAALEISDQPDVLF